MKLKATKAAIMAFALFGISTAYADTFSWVPHLMPNAPKDSDHRINLWGGAHVSIVNDSDDVHEYDLRLNLLSPDCITSDRHEHWQEPIQVAPHSTYTTDKDLNVAIECNRGERESKIEMNIRDRKTHNTIFEQSAVSTFFAK